MTPTGAEALRDLVASHLVTARERTELLTGCIDDGDLVRQHSPLMSPLVWDLAHVANQEELWLLREVGGREPMHPEIDPLYDAFEHPRAERPTLPLLPPAEARAYAHEVRGRVLDLVERTRCRCRARCSYPAGCSTWAPPPSRGRWITSGRRTRSPCPGSTSTPPR